MIITTCNNNNIYFQHTRDNAGVEAEEYKLMFAVDTAGLASDKNLSTLVKNVNAELEKIARWFRSNKMAVNVSKLNLLYFTQRVE
jgi:hypothetical protein